MEQGAHRGYGISILGDAENPVGDSPTQALSRGIELGMNLNHFVFFAAEPPVSCFPPSCEPLFTWLHLSNTPVSYLQERKTQTIPSPHPC